MRKNVAISELSMFLKTIKSIEKLQDWADKKEIENKGLYLNVDFKLLDDCLKMLKAAISNSPIDR